MPRAYKEWFEYDLDDAVVMVKVTIIPGSCNMWGHPDNMEPDDPDEWEVEIESVDGVPYDEWDGVIPRRDLESINKIAEEMV